MPIDPDVQTELNRLQSEIDTQQGEIDALESIVDPPAGTDRAADPNLLSYMETGDSAPVAAAMTNNPARSTFFVPNPDTTILNLGAGAPVASANRIPEQGLAGQTNTHIHWQTVVTSTPSKLPNSTTPDPLDYVPKRTIVSLGGPLNPGRAGEVVDSKKIGSTTDTDFDTGKRNDPTTHQPYKNGTADRTFTVPFRNSGYSMLTDGYAWHESQDQHCVVSHKGDVVVRAASAKTALLQSDSGSVEVIGGSSVAIGAVSGGVTIKASSDLSTRDVKYATGYPSSDTGWRSILMWVLKDVYGYIDIATSLYTFATWIGFAIKPPIQRAPGWAGWIPDAGTIANRTKDTIIFASALSRSIAGDADAMKQSVSISADHTAGLSGSISASVFGGMSAYIYSFMNVATWGLRSALNGAVYASVWSMVRTWLGSVKDVVVESEWATSKLTSWKGTSVESTRGGVTVQGHKHTQLISVDGRLHAFGARGAFIGAASPAPAPLPYGAPLVTALAGYGMSIKSDGITITKFAAPSTHTAAPVPVGPAFGSIRIRDAPPAIDLNAGPATVIRMTATGINMKGGPGNANVGVNGSLVQVNGAMIAIG